MLSAVEQLIIGVAVWRVSHLIVHEEGPFHLVERVRNWLNASADWNFVINMLAELVTCVYCTSVWIGFAFSLLTGSDQLLVDTFFFSAVAIFTEKAHSRAG